jgi:fimbrial protein
MKFHHKVLTVIAACTLVFVAEVPAKGIKSTIRGGEVHMKGILTEGGCEVSSESQDMHIDMGQYNTHSFDRAGALATNIIPFSIRLTGCESVLAEGVGIMFAGMTDPKEPDVFLVTSAEGSPVGITGNSGYSGIGLMISDAAGNEAIPGNFPAAFTKNSAEDEIELHYLARYRATSRHVYPGPLRSEVWFNISYP